MPRPGPRPYECVRRAWHSDRHQPIRGTLIQEIFRVVDEIHSSTTKKNREYQEKLPVVVLRAEKIMYSKANSEAEYMDLTTLMERTNDAIDTIIRRDESTETGDYLHPCIEAALCLGCSPRKASRSQRNSPRCYLNPMIQEFSSDSHNAVAGVHTTKSRYLSDNVASTSKKQCLEHQPSSNMFSIYPLYHGTEFRFDDSQNRYPVRPAIMGVVQNHLVSNLNASNQRMEPFTRGNPENPLATGCDLSLRLGSPSIPTPSHSHQLQEGEDRSKFRGQKCSSFAGDGAFRTLDCFSNKPRLGDEYVGVRKRKATLPGPMKNQLFLHP